MDDEVPISGTGGGCWTALSGVATRDCDKQRVVDLCGLDQQGPCPHADRNPAPDIGVQGSAVLEGEEFPQAHDGISAFEAALLGTAPMGQRLLGCIERKCDR